MTTFLAFIAMTAIATTANGWALTVLWRWFIVPTFALAPLSVPAAMGFVLIVHFLTFRLKRDPPVLDWDKELGIWMLALILKIATALALGWIYLQFMP